MWSISWFPAKILASDTSSSPWKAATTLFHISLIFLFNNAVWKLSVFRLVNEAYHFQPRTLAFSQSTLLSTFRCLHLFCHSVLNLSQSVLYLQLHGLITWKFLMNVFKRKYLDVPTLQLEKFSNSGRYDWVSIRSQWNEFLPEGSQKFSKTSRRLTRSPTIE